MGLLGVSGNYAVEFDILAACLRRWLPGRHSANIKRLLSELKNNLSEGKVIIVFVIILTKIRGMRNE